MPSIISADLKIVGDLNSSGDLQIDGLVEGNVTSRGLIVGQGAVIRGTLAAETVRVYGTVAGDIRANRVMLAPSAKVEGNIAHETISMESGASLTGQLRPLERAAGAGKTAAPGDAGTSKAAGDTDPTRTPAGAPGAGERRSASY